MDDALMFGHNESKKLCKLQKELFQKLGVTKREVVKPELDAEMLAQIESQITDELRDELDNVKHDKLKSYKLSDELKLRTVNSYPEDDPDKRKSAGKIFNHLK